MVAVRDRHHAPHSFYANHHVFPMTSGRQHTSMTRADWVAMILIVALGAGLVEGLRHMLTPRAPLAAQTTMDQHLESLP